MIEVRAARKEDVPGLAQALSKAFVDDPFARWTFGAHEGLPERLRLSFLKLLSVTYMPKKHTYTTDDLSGAALWAPPGKWKMTMSQQLRMAPAFIRLIGMRRLAAAGQVGRIIEKAHPDEPHWHLSVLGVAPDQQRSGVGRALVSHILRRADGEGVLAHLETSKPDNVAYYQRFGFEISSEFDAPQDGPHMWTMTRRPGAGT